MKKTLIIKSSILGEQSTSSLYADILAQKIGQEDSIVTRDVSSQLVTQLTPEALGNLQDPSSAVSIEHKSLIDEIKSADNVIIASPMYNFNIPSTLKNYLDAITKAGETFKYNENGQPVGFLTNKKTYVIISRGGKYKEHGLTFQEDYLKMHLSFIGLSDIKFIFLEGLNMGTSKEETAKSFETQI